MIPKVFGIGLNKTGTTTLAVCLKQLGYSHTSHSLDLTRCYVQGDLEPIFAVADRFDSFEDWPWPLLYKELDVRYPGSKFILTTRRNADVWFRSLRSHANRTGPTEFRRLVYGYDMPGGRRREHVAFYERHNDAVRSYFAGRPHDFLEVCWEDGDGWDTICGFLGLTVPEEPFPHANRRPDFWKQSRRKLQSILGRA